MPCSSEGYSKSRSMNRSEQFVSLERHHIVVEKETEALREYATALENKLKELKKVIPGLDIVIQINRPHQTNDWRPVTYRDPVTGKFPCDIQPHNDWLSEEDY